LADFQPAEGLKMRPPAYGFSIGMGTKSKQKTCSRLMAGNSRKFVDSFFFFHLS
jgi:hypothetical protein